jgi:hypothetical protein
VSTSGSTPQWPAFFYLSSSRWGSITESRVVQVSKHHAAGILRNKNTKKFQLLLWRMLALYSGVGPAQCYVPHNLWPLPSRLQSALFVETGHNVKQSQSKPRSFCWICGNTIELETCKTDEHGMAVHGDCYFLKVVLANESMRLLVRKPAHRSGRMIVSDLSSRKRSSAAN